MTDTPKDTNQRAQEYVRETLRAPRPDQVNSTLTDADLRALAAEALFDEEECETWKEPLPWAMPEAGSTWDRRGSITRQDEMDRVRAARQRREANASTREPELARALLQLLADYDDAIDRADEEGSIRGHERQRYLCTITATGAGGSYETCETRTVFDAYKAAIQAEFEAAGPFGHKTLSKFLGNVERRLKGETPHPWGVPPRAGIR